MTETCEARGCNAQAHVKADLRGTGTLYYCAHHGTEYMPRLVALGFEIEREPVECGCRACVGSTENDQ